MAGKKKTIQEGKNHIERLQEDTDIHHIRTKINELIDVNDNLCFHIKRIDEQILILFKQLVVLEFEINQLKFHQK